MTNTLSKTKDKTQPDKALISPWPFSSNRKHQTILDRIKIDHIRLTRGLSIEGGTSPFYSTCREYLTIKYMVELKVFQEARFLFNISPSLAE